MATRLELQTRARTRADQDGSDFPNDVQYQTFLDEAARETFGDLVLSGWPVNYTTSTIVTNVNTGVYAFGGTDTVFSVLLVYTNMGGQQLELHRVNPGSVAALRSTSNQGGPSQFYEARMDINTGPVVEFFARSAGTYFVDYVADFAGFANDAAVWRGPARSDELLVLLAAAKGCKKEGRTDAAESLRSEYRELLVKVKDLASWFDQRNSAMIRDVKPFEGFSGRNASFEYFAGPGGMF